MYKKSNQLLKRALKSIPLASQTFSKSLTQYPEGVSPFFIKKGKGSKVIDEDGESLSLKNYGQTLNEVIDNIVCINTLYINKSSVTNVFILTNCFKSP